MISSSQAIFQAPENEPHLSIVIPAYNEGENLEELHKELMKILPQLDMLWEVVFVDDGSKDQTWEKIKSINKKDSRIKGVRFSRNFGHQYALFAGLIHARGQAVITMDADLQHPPALIPQLLEEWQKGSKIVQTVRKDNQNISWIKKSTSKLYYKLFSLLSGINLSSGVADFRLLDRQIVNEIVRSKEVSLFLRGLVKWLGYSTTKVEYVCNDRFSGSSKYNLKKMLKLAWTGIISFSVIPLRMAIVLGFLTSSYAFYRLIYAYYIKRFTDTAVPGWASTIGVMSLMFGILFILLGVIGEYIGRILIQVQGRERFIVSEKLESSTSSNHDEENRESTSIVCQRAKSEKRSDLQN